MKTQRYSKAQIKFSWFSSTYSLLENVLYYKYDVLPLLWAKAGDLLAKTPYFRATNTTIQSIYFVALMSLLLTLTSLPKGYYKTFVLEEKYGFNKLTKSLFFADLVKQYVLLMVLVSPLLAAFLKIIDYFGDNFAFYALLMFIVFMLFIETIYPTVIQPIFNKVEPLEAGELRQSIEALASKNKFPLSNIYVIDGSKRSGHSNAFFMGLPWIKQIVLFDTLIESATIQETTAVLAHEIGHWALLHNFKKMGMMYANAFLFFKLFSFVINNSKFYEDFGFIDEKPVLIGFLLFNDVMQPYDCVFNFVSNVLSRKFEYEADNYALKQGYSKELSRSLIKLQIDNLSATRVDPIYSAYKYSHPTLAERLSALGYVPEGKIEVPKKEEKEKKSEKSE